MLAFCFGALENFNFFMYYLFICLATKRHRKAATQGVTKSQFALGLIYEKGKGVKKDLAEAAKWYGEAAAQGDVEAIRKVAKLKKLGF